MPRAPRIHVPGGFYHVTLRGNHREAIFRTSDDRDELDAIVGEAAQRHDVGLHAYCWMTNHIHLLARVDEAPLGRMIHAVASRYARHYQRSIPTTGHLFERRYHGRLVATDSYLIEVIRYIHLNPVSAGIVHSAADYPWSSHRGYLGRGAPTWLTVEYALATLDESPGMARARYERFIATSEPEARTGIAPPYPLERDPASLQDLDLQGDARGDNADLESLIARTCSDAGVAIAAIEAPSRARRLSRLRAEIAAEAVRRGIATLAEVAARMKRHPSVLTRLLQKRPRRAPRSE